MKLSANSYNHATIARTIITIALVFVAISQSFADIPVSINAKGKIELPKGFKLDYESSEYIVVKTKENGVDTYIICTPQGKEIYKSNIPSYVRYSKEYGGEKYMFIGWEDKYVHMVNSDGKDMLYVTPDIVLDFVECGGAGFFLVRITNDGKEFVLLPDGKRLFEDNLIHHKSITPVDTGEGVMFIVHTFTTGYHPVSYYSLADIEGYILIPENEGEISKKTIGGKTYFYSYRQIHSGKDFSPDRYPIMYDAHGRQLPDVLKSYDSYIELDGHAFFILHKTSKGFGGKIEKGQCYIYSPDYNIDLPWSDSDINLSITGNELVKTDKNGNKTSVALNITQEKVPAPTALPDKPAANFIASSYVDKDIPKADISRNETFVLIISNENYQEVASVPYALNDGAIFEKYCTSTLGIPQKNIRFCRDATLNQMRRQLNWLKEVADAYGSSANIIVYYSGHGIPAEDTAEAFLVPTDGYTSDMRSNFPVSELYQTLSEFPSSSVIVFMDACFTGSLRGDGMLASARGVAIKPKEAAPKGQLVVMTAAQGDQTAYPIDEYRHGAFTYFLLKKLKDSKGKATLGELSDYVSSEVRKWSVVENSKVQQPAVNVSPALSEIWRQINL